MFTKIIFLFPKELLGHPNKMFHFPSPRLLWWWVGRSGKIFFPEKAGLLNKKAWLQSQLENVVFSFVIRSIDVIKDKDITSYQLLLIKQDRVLVN